MIKLVIFMMMVIEGELLQVHDDRVGHLPRLVVETAAGKTFSFDSKQNVKYSHST